MISTEQVVFKHYPLLLWLTGAMFLAIGVTLGVAGSDSVVAGVLDWVAAIAFFTYASTLTVTVDRKREILSLRYRSLLHASTKAYRFSDIALVDVAEDSERERMYRVELHLRTGQVIPLRTFYSVGRRRKERRAQRIRSAIGM
jgi:hypothetical protein